jgi:LPXTG-motif cell wall-anchored protein
MQFVSCSEGDSILNWLTFPATFTKTSSDGESVSTMDGVTIRAPMFQLNYQSSDLPSSTGTSRETTGSTRETMASNTSDADTEPSSGLSTGAQAGIGVGVGLAGLLLIGAGLYFWRRKRNTRTPVPTEEEPKSESPGNYISEVDGSTPRYPPAELEAATPELEGSHTPSHTVRS